MFGLSIPVPVPVPWVSFCMRISSSYYIFFIFTQKSKFWQRRIVKGEIITELRRRAQALLNLLERVHWSLSKTTKQNPSWITNPISLSASQSLRSRRATEDSSQPRLSARDQIDRTSGIKIRFELNLGKELIWARINKERSRNRESTRRLEKRKR